MEENSGAVMWITAPVYANTFSIQKWITPRY